MTWLGFLLRNLARRPGRSIFTLLGVALATGSFLTLTGLSRGMVDASQASLAERGIDLVVVQRGMVEFFASTLPDSLGAGIAGVAEVAEVAGELSTLLPVGEDAHAIVSGWDPQGFQWRRLPLARGRLPGPGEAGVVLGDAVAEAMHVDVGDDVTLNFSRMRVTGIAGFSSLLNRGMAVMRLDSLQTLLARPGQVTLFHVRLRPGGAQASARRAISALRPGLSVTTANEVLSDNKAVQTLAAASGAVALVALVMASLSVLNTLAMAVEERTREIGILAAIGWSRGRILGLILGEGLLLAACGGVLGGGIGWLGNLLLGLTVVPGAGMPLAAVLWLGTQAMLAALALGAAGAFWPAWRAARISPALALRRE